MNKLKILCLLFILASSNIVQAQVIITNPPTPFIMECDNATESSAIQAWIDNYIASDYASTDCATSTNITWSHDWSGIVPQACGPSINITFTATDECGFSATASEDLSIVDTTPPSITGTPINMTVECDGTGNEADFNSWFFGNLGLETSDICSYAVMNTDFAGLSDLCGATGATISNFIASDVCGNEASVEVTFTIVDTTPPSVDVPASDLVLECDPAHQQSEIDAWLNNNGGALSTDLCSDVTWNHDYVLGSENNGCALTGTLLVTFIATDDCGLQSTTSANIIITDNTPPSINESPSDLVVSCDGSGNINEVDAWLQNHGNLIADDACGEVSVSHNYVGYLGNCGLTTVIFTVSDLCGNTTLVSALINFQEDPVETSSIFDLQGNIYLDSLASGVVVKSGNGACWLMGVDDNGGIKTKSVICPN